MRTNLHRDNIAVRSAATRVGPGRLGGRTCQPAPRWRRSHLPVLRLPPIQGRSAGRHSARSIRGPWSAAVELEDQRGSVAGGAGMASMSTRSMLPSSPEVTRSRSRMFTGRRQGVEAFTTILSMCSATRGFAGLRGVARHRLLAEDVLAGP